MTVQDTGLRPTPTLRASAETLYPQKASPDSLQDLLPSKQSTSSRQPALDASALPHTSKECLFAVLVLHSHHPLVEDA